MESTQIPGSEERRLAEVYLWTGKTVIVTGMSRAVAGFWMANGWWRSCEQLQAAELGGLVKQALETCEYGQPVPNWNESPLPIQPVLDDLGVRSWPTFMRKAQMASIAQAGSTVTATPMRNGGAKGGYQPKEELALEVVNPTAELIGRLTLDALAQAD